MVDIDELLSVIGAFGRYQKTQFVLLCIPAGLVAAILAFHGTFLSASPIHWCNVPSLMNSNLTVDQQKDLAIPRTKDGTFESCVVYDINFTNYLADHSGNWPPNSSNVWEKTSCQHGWVYDKSVFHETLVTKFNLVCNEDWLPPLSKSLFYLGSFIGNFLFGFISDRYGRRRALFLILIWMISFTLISISSVNFYMYMVLRFLVGFGFPSVYQIPFICTMELMAPDKRTMVGNVIATVFALGLAILALLAYLSKNWIDLTLLSSLPFTLLFVYYWLVPESPRWLLSQNRVEEAEVILRKAAKMNGKTMPKDFLLSFQPIESFEQDTKLPTIWDLVRTPNMRKKLLIILICWVINAVVYTVLSFQASGLGVNEYLGFAISGLVELPAYVGAWYFMDKVGRRWSIFATMIIGGIACIITIFLPSEMVWVIISLAMLGKCGIAASFSIIYVFAGELNPTTIRTTAIGTYSSAAGIALIGSPYIVYLTKFNKNLPLMICGILCIIGAVAILFLPETLYMPLPQTIKEGEGFGRKFVFFSIPRPKELRKRFSQIPDSADNIEMRNGNSK